MKNFGLQGEDLWLARGGTLACFFEGHGRTGAMDGRRSNRRSTICCSSTLFGSLQRKMADRVAVAPQLCKVLGFCTRRKQHVKSSYIGVCAALTGGWVARFMTGVSDCGENIDTRWVKVVMYCTYRWSESGNVLHLLLSGTVYDGWVNVVRT